MNLEVFVGELAQDHALDPFQVEQSVNEGGAKGFEKGCAGIVIHQLEQVPQRERGAARRALFESLEIFAGLRESFPKEFFLLGPNRSGEKRGRAGSDVRASDTCGPWAR
jgi:hypothetical protein